MGPFESNKSESEEFVIFYELEFFPTQLKKKKEEVNFHIIMSGSLSNHAASQFEINECLIKLTIFGSYKSLSFERTMHYKSL